jgi:demethylmenaquinone methyltransferase/2-methoxy-6-polyprenyl-1,4-benzoquinol methylase
MSQNLMNDPSRGERNMGLRMGRPQEEMVAYYDRRADEFDAWWETQGPFAGRDRPEWNEELEALTALLRALPAGGPTLDLGCGTGYVTRLLPGPGVVGLDTSPAMLRRARERLPRVPFVRGHALHLPFRSGSFARVFTSHVYGHVLPEDRAAFLGEARRVAPSLVVIDAACRGGEPRDEWQERVLADGSRHRVYKRFLTGATLRAELRGGRVLHEGYWFVAVAEP